MWFKLPAGPEKYKTSTPKPRAHAHTHTHNDTQHALSSVPGATPGDIMMAGLNPPATETNLLFYLKSIP